MKPFGINDLAPASAALAGSSRRVRRSRNVSVTTQETPPRQDDNTTVGAPPEDARAAPSEGLSLLVFEPRSSRLFPLPASGDVIIGRGAEAQLRVHDQSVSRAHARISVLDGEATIADLG